MTVGHSFVIFMVLCLLKSKFQYNMNIIENAIHFRNCILVPDKGWSSGCIHVLLDVIHVLGLNCGRYCYIRCYWNFEHTRDVM